MDTNAEISASVESIEGSPDITGESHVIWISHSHPRVLGSRISVSGFQLLLQAIGCTLHPALPSTCHYPFYPYMRRLAKYLPTFFLLYLPELKSHIGTK